MDWSCFMVHVTVQCNSEEKRHLQVKVQNYITRSNKVSIVRTTGATATNGLTASKFYGLRIEDNEISLNVPDVVKCTCSIRINR